MKVIRYAESELSRHLGMVSNAPANIKLCLFEELGMKPSGKNPALDDEIFIDVTALKGTIAGSNPRSVLLGVYRFLTECGFMWIRPGEGGISLPEKDISAISVKIHEAASYRHRGVCIEGANTLQNILDIVDWAPKVGFNSYFMQFRDGFTFFERYSSHTGNPYFEKEELTKEQIGEYVKEIRQEIYRRGLLYHAVGHGWTCEPFGEPSEGWYETEKEPSDEVRGYLAEINGRREWFKGIPLNTNLCYSQKKARDIMNLEIIKYLEENPNVNYLHLWLGDSTNSICECSECSKLRVSDYYVMLLNELDEMLTKKGIDSKIVFLAYYQTLYAPVTQKLKNQDRFVLMFAPITRSYTEPMKKLEHKIELPEYNGNNFNRPTTEESLQYLEGWQETFEGDSFDFDYHLMWDFAVDAGGMRISKTLYEDTKALSELGLNGIVSCQVQRVFMPSALPMYVLGQTLWNKNADFDTLTKRLFDATFGGTSQKVIDYLSALSGIYDMSVLRGRKEVSRPQLLEYKKAYDLIEEFRQVIAENIAAATGHIKQSWEYLGHHANIYSPLSKAVWFLGENKDEEAKELWYEALKYTQVNEPKLQPVLDTFIYSIVLNDDRPSLINTIK